MAKVERSPEQARIALTNAAGEYYGVFPTRRSTKRLRKKLGNAIQRAKGTQPPISGEEIIAILDDAKQTGQDVSYMRNSMVGRRLHLSE